MSSAPTTYTALADLETAIDNTGLNRGYSFKGLLKSIVRSVGGANTIGGIQVPLTFDIADGSADTTYDLVIPFDGTISKIYTVTDGAVGTADITITPSIGGSGITNGVVTIATSGSAAGDVDSSTPSAANTVTAGQAVRFTVAGGGAGGSPRIHVTVVLTRS